MITGRVRGQELQLSSPRIVADTIDYLTAVFTFQTADWAGLDICSHWQKGTTVYDIWLENGQITKDKHLNLSAGTWTVWLHGNENVDGEVKQRITTEKAELTVKATGTLNGEPFPEVPASELERINARLKRLEEGYGGEGTGGGSNVPYLIGFGLSVSEDYVLSAEVGASSFVEIPNTKVQEIFNRVMEV